MSGKDFEFTRFHICSYAVEETESDTHLLFNCCLHRERHVEVSADLELQTLLALREKTLQSNAIVSLVDGSSKPRIIIATVRRFLSGKVKPEEPAKEALALNELHNTNAAKPPARTATSQLPSAGRSPSN